MLFILAFLVLNSGLSSAQTVTAITQAPGYSSLNSCAQGVAKAVIDDSTSPECSGGSPPSCFCNNENLSREWASQISTNILNNCATSARPQATSASAVFAAYCSIGAQLAVANTSTDNGASTATPAVATTGSQATTTAGAGPTSDSSSSSGGGGKDDGSQPSGMSTKEKLEIALPIAIVLGLLLLGGVLWCCGCCRKQGDISDTQSKGKPRLSQIKKTFG